VTRRGAQPSPRRVTISSPREEVLTIWTIYQNHPAHPGQFVVRAYDVLPVGYAVPRAETVVRSTLDEARQAVPCGLYWMNRNPVDDPTIVETERGIQ
jgi:hypothetical protein